MCFLFVFFSLIGKIPTAATTELIKLTDFTMIDSMISKPAELVGYIHTNVSAILLFLDKKQLVIFLGEKKSAKSTLKTRIKNLNELLCNKNICFMVKFNLILGKFNTNWNWPKN